jgi:hypothetical protein
MALGVAKVFCVQFPAQSMLSSARAAKEQARGEGVSLITGEVSVTVAQLFEPESVGS